MTTFEIMIKGLPKTPNQRMHWTVRMRETKMWREAAYVAAMQQQRPAKPLTRVALVLIRASSKQCDIDNHVASFKAIIDGLRDARVIADDHPGVVSQIRPEWIKVGPKVGYIKVIVEEL